MDSKEVWAGTNLRDGIQHRAPVKHTPGLMASALNPSLATRQWWTISTQIVLENWFEKKKSQTLLNLLPLLEPKKVLQRRIYKIFSKYNKTYLHSMIGQDFFLKCPLIKEGCSRLHHPSYSYCVPNQFLHGASSNVFLLHNPLEHQHPEGSWPRRKPGTGSQRRPCRVSWGISRHIWFVWTFIYLE